MNDIIVKPLSLDLSLSRSQLLLLVKQEINISTFQLCDVCVFRISF